MLLSQTQVFYFLSLQPKYRRPLIFQTMNSVRSNNLTLKYQKFTPLGCKDRRINTFTVHASVKSAHYCTMYIVHTYEI